MAKQLFFIVLFCFLGSAVFAQASYSFEDSVMMPGSRLLAGDLTKNEFFILGKDDLATKQEPNQPKPLVTAETKSETNKTKTNIKHSIPKIKTAIKQALNENRPKRTFVRVKTAFKKKETFKPVIKSYEQMFKTSFQSKNEKPTFIIKEFSTIAAKEKVAAKVKRANYKVEKIKSKPKVKTATKSIKKLMTSSKKPVVKQI